MYHVELRQFPHNFCRFNLSDAELTGLLAPWRSGQPIELGERKWSPHQAKIRILEGPELELQELTMGRGWRTAESRSREVTDRVLAPVPPEGPAAGVPGRAAPDPGAAALADPFAALVQIGALLGPEAPRLLEAWRTAAAGDPSLSPSEALASAEQSLRGADESAQPHPPEA